MHENDGKPNNLDLQAIHPTRGPQYSPNLYRWLTRRGRTSRAWLARVYRDAQGLLWIGDIDRAPDGTRWFSGTKLNAVLCNGAAEPCWAYGNLADKLTEVEDFWPRYMEIGRCAIDVEHTTWFIDDKTRWSVDGDARSCLWCGRAQQVMKRYTEAVERAEWQIAA